MKKIITAALPFALFAMALTSCGGSPSVEEYSVTFPDINGLVPPTNLKVKKGQDYTATIGVNQDLVPGATLPKDLTKVTSGNGVLTKGEGYTYDLKENDTKADFKIPAKNITGDIAVELELVVPTPGEVKVTSIDFTLEKDEATVGEQVKIKDIKVLPDNATNKSINWSVTPEGYAEIHTMGAEPYVVGTAPTQEPLTITATAADGSGVKKTATLSITPKYIESLVVTMGELKVGETKTPGVQITPNDATDTSYHLVITEGTDYAEVVEEGHSLKGLAAGKAKVKAVADDGSKVESEPVQFEVKTVAATSIEVTATETSLYLGDTTQLFTTITPEDATVQDVTYAVTDGDAVTVDDDGEVTAVKAGTATITATLTQTGIGNELTDTIDITVDDDLLLNAELSYEGQPLPFEYLDEYDGRTSVVKLSGDNSGSWVGDQIRLHHAADTHGVFQFDVKADSNLSDGRYEFRFYDSNWKEINKNFYFGNATTSWTTISTNLYLDAEGHTAIGDYVGSLNDLLFVKIFLTDSGAKITGDIYFDNFRFVKGTKIIPSGDDQNLTFSDYKCTQQSISEFQSKKKAYIEVKAEGTGDATFVLLDENWANISGNRVLKFVNGIPNATTDEKVIDLKPLSDGWFGVTFELTGGQLSTATAFNMFHVPKNTVSDGLAVWFDINTVSPIEYNYQSLYLKNQNRTFNEFNISNLDYDGNSTLNVKIKPYASGDNAVVKFVLMSGWTNMSGDIAVNINSANEVTSVKRGDSDVIFEASEDGWYVIKIKRNQFLYPYGEGHTIDNPLNTLNRISTPNWDTAVANLYEAQFDCNNMTIQPISK